MSCDYGKHGLYLAHYGVLGMRWGVRKEKPPSKALKKLYGKTVGKVKKNRYGIAYAVSTGSIGLSGAAFVATALTGPIGGSAVFGVTSLASAAVGYKAYTMVRDGFWDTKNRFD